MTAPDLRRDLTAALDAEQAQLAELILPRWVVNRAQALIDMRRDIAERHTPMPSFGRLVCDFCSDDIGRIADWPCVDYLSVARATLPADHPALNSSHGCLPDGTHEQGCGYGGHG